MRRCGMVVCACLAILVVLLVWGSQTQLGQAIARVYAPWLAARPDDATASRQPLPKFAFDVRTGILPWLPPGTVVPDAPPSEWTHLLIKNDVKITSGESGRPAENLNKLLSNFSLATVANVTPPDDKQPYHMLKRVAMGWCVDVHGSPTVVSSSTYEEHGAELDAVEAVVLAMQELECEKNTRVIARSAITMLYEVEYFFAYGEEHVASRLRYAVLVHPRTGELAVFTWVVPPGNVDPPGGRVLRRLPENLITTFELRLMPRSGGGIGLPSPSDVAIAKLPPLEEVATIGPELAASLYADSFTPETAEQLQARLWEFLGWP